MGVDSRPGLYVHVPFCRSKCVYCGFFSVTALELVPRWLTALAAEMSACRNLFAAFDTLYVGGGTPSLLAPEDLGVLSRALRAHFRFAPGCEITLEANPGDVTRERIAAWRELGVNRVSLGVQSLDDKVLTWLGRRHDRAAALAAYHALRAAGFDNIGIDLIYGVPGQTIKAWVATLRAAVALAPEHLSCYQLTLDPGSALARRGREADLDLPGEAQGRAFFLATSGFLERNGYVQYEISNFARSEALTARHNAKYWRHVPYLGLGPAAHSFDGQRRWWNTASVEGYCAALEAGKRPLAGSEELSAGQRRLEALALACARGRD